MNGGGDADADGCHFGKPLPIDAHINKGLSLVERDFVAVVVVSIKPL